MNRLKFRTYAPEGSLFDQDAIERQCGQELPIIAPEGVTVATVRGADIVAGGRAMEIEVEW